MRRLEIISLRRQSRVEATTVMNATLGVGDAASATASGCVDGGVA
jgi:hypothetical protein